MDLHRKLYVQNKILTVKSAAFTGFINKFFSNNYNLDFDLGSHLNFVLAKKQQENVL